MKGNIFFSIIKYPSPQPNNEIRNPSIELKVTLISVTICSLIFFICARLCVTMRQTSITSVLLVVYNNLSTAGTLIDMSNHSCLAHPNYLVGTVKVHVWGYRVYIFDSYLISVQTRFPRVCRNARQWMSVLRVLITIFLKISLRQSDFGALCLLFLIETFYYCFFR